MSSDIVLSAALRNNLLSLQNTQRSIDTTQLRLATGLKVNSALDNPQNFFAAQNLGNRAGDLQRLLDGIGSSIRTIEEADTGVTALQDLINQADAVATEALSEARSAEGFARIRGTEDLRGVDLIADTTVDLADAFSVIVEEEDGTQATVATVTIGANYTVDNIVADINSSVANTDLVRASVTQSGQLQIESLTDGASLRIQDSADSAAGGTEIDISGFNDLGLGGFVQAENTNTTATSVRYGGTAIAGNIIRSAVAANTALSGQYEASQLLGADVGNGTNFLNTGAAGVDELRINISVDGSTSANIDLALDSTVQEYLDGINNDATIGALVTATFDTATGQIEIQAADNVGQVEIQYTDITGTANSAFEFGTGAGDGAIGTALSIQSEQFTFVGTSVDLEQFESDYNNIRTQIDGLVEDASFRGVNLLNGDNLTTFFNEDRDNTLTTDGVDFTSLGLGIDEGAFTTSASIQLSIDDLRGALGRVRNFGQSIANDLAIIQTRRDFTESTINTLEAGRDDLTVADLNEEGANLLSLQTRQQLGTTSLALASQSQQSVLRLF